MHFNIYQDGLWDNVWDCSIPLFGVFQNPMLKNSLSEFANRFSLLHSEINVKKSKCENSFQIVYLFVTGMYSKY